MHERRWREGGSSVKRTYPSEYLLVMIEPTASITDADTKFSDGMSSSPFH